ncbi:hypothetical protein [Nostoc sp. FACHB-110]|nr:hypothetical protein [Nostoc sp. FACHB-110]MBD2439707.1 hypothetical protein [Nostoc sp. FACHB-110]
MKGKSAIADYINSDRNYLALIFLAINNIDEYLEMTRSLAQPEFFIF